MNEIYLMLLGILICCLIYSDLFSNYLFTRQNRVSHLQWKRVPIGKQNDISTIEPVFMVKTMIDLLKDSNSEFRTPNFLKVAEINRQIAVIQDTYRSDSVDMYFDKLLWLQLLEFATQYGHDHDVSIINRSYNKQRPEPEKADEVQLDVFLSAWHKLDVSDQEPPEYIIVRNKEKLVLCIATEYWTRFGGPYPYHDSYTYSIFSKDDLSESITNFLVNSNAARGWELSILSYDPRPALPA